jgi:RNA polymerase sigma-70 factor (ECF subfamily)
MFKPLLKRMFPQAAAGHENPLTSAIPQPDYVRLVTRIIEGDATAEAELVELFRDPVLHIIRRLTNNSSMVEDFSQETLITVIKKIRNGDLHQPESLAGFIVSTARFHTIEQLRRIKQRAVIEDLDQAEQVPDPTPNRLEQLVTSEQGDEIRNLLEELTPRYRELLLRFYINEESKEVICVDLGLTSAQFDGVLHRARNRYRTLYLERKRRAEKWGRK